MPVPVPVAVPLAVASATGSVDSDVQVVQPDSESEAPHCDGTTTQPYYMIGTTTPERFLDDSDLLSALRVRLQWDLGHSG